MNQYGLVHEGKTYWPEGPPTKMAPKAEVVHCDRCYAECVPKGITTGYGRYTNHLGKEERLCFACCAEVDKAEMILSGRAILYLTKDEAGFWWKVTNWPGTLRFTAREVKTRKVRAGFCIVERRDVWFWFEGELWWGRGQGDNDIVRCRRTKVTKEQ